MEAPSEREELLHSQDDEVGHMGLMILPGDPDHPEFAQM